jgi:alpha-N-arabinofuranosidase
MKIKRTAALLLGIALSVSATQSKDYNVGVDHPLKTISAAAELAQPGDTITVHAGVYRERMDPPRGGTSDGQRITYQAAPGEKVVITGAEPRQGWEKVGGDTWKVAVPNSYFGDFNPFSHKIQGEWCEPTGRHAASVYLDGEWLGESLTLDPVLKPAGKSPLWFAEVGGDNTTIWAQFPGVNPNDADVEISKRQSVFYPSKTGINFITVRGFELCRAATPWGGAMSEQVGLIGTHWSKEWIIENNHIHHSMCKGVSLGRYELPAGEIPPETAPGFVKSMELALRDGWSKEKVGSHIVRNNRIHHCEKNAIHGSLGAAFSEISGNEIHDIALTGWVRGPDTGGIKFLGGVDMVIRDNHIHHCGAVSGIWLDWSCQGTLVEGNLLHDNSGHHGDLFLEMQHGPLLIANNILLSRYSLAVNSEGMAIVHNLIAGRIRLFSDPRETPFHPPHAVSIKGLYSACGGDHRFYNNLLKSPVDFGTSRLPSVEAGNAILPKGTVLTREPEGWRLSLTADSTDSSQRKIVTTELLGTAIVANCPFENRDGSPITIDTDYFGKPRDPVNPGAGPFAGLKPGRHEIKVWLKEIQQ